MVKIIKKDGKKEEFIPEKIVVSTIKAGAPPETAREIAKKLEAQLKKLNEMSTTELREMILDMLDEKNKEWKENWLVYEKVVKKRT
jgi:transcriptional repressor NrdR